MSTFDGLIREFPTVAIDNFKARPGVHVYLLSHVHSDHLGGLAVKNWDSPIYCSQITAKWLPMLATRSKQIAFETGQDRVLQRKYAHLVPYLKPLATDVPHYLDIGSGRKARLNLIPAHHCPGAVMFLLQDDLSCILYTGDARNEALDLQGLSSMSIFSSSMQRIDRLYLDTTFCHQAFQEFPSRETVISGLITFINRRPRLAHYYIDAWTFGYEDIWIGLAKAFHTKIHVSPYMYGLYEAIDDLIHPRVLPHLTMDGTFARFHSCRLGQTCGYGNAGGEHSSARELIRIQPNVMWFSPLLNKKGQNTDAESILAQGKVVGRTSTFKIKEMLPPGIGKRDDLCYYINYTFHASLSELQQLVKLVSPRALFPCVLHRDATFGTLFRSNSEVVALLTKSMPDNAFSSDIEEYSDRRPCFADGITTDFQSFYRAKGHQVLDMNDHLLGITSEIPSRRPSQKVAESNAVDGGEGSSTTAGTKPALTKDCGPVLSPRSQHLRKKMEKLKRQLRSTASLEEEGVLDEESSLEDGPLSLDLGGIEKKRKWWVEYDRGKSPTQEDRHTGGEETDPQSSGIQSSGPYSSGSQNDRLRGDGPLNTSDNGISAFDNERLDDGRVENHETRGAKAWFDQSTLELESQLSENDRHIVLANESVTSKGYLSSSPDPDLSSISLIDHTSENSSHSIPSSGSILRQSSFIQAGQFDTLAETADLANATTKGSPQRMTELGTAFSKGYLSISSTSSLPAEPAEAANAGPEGSSQRTTEVGTALSKELLSISSTSSIPTPLGSPPCNVMLSPPSSNFKTPPRPHACKIDLGESPSTLSHSCTIPRPPSSPTSKRTLPIHPFKSPYMLHEPIKNILAQLAWSPPLQLTRLQTDPRHGPQRELKRHNSIPRPSRASTTVTAAVDNGTEVILIESSDDDDSQPSSSVRQEARQGRITKRQKGKID